MATSEARRSQLRLLNSSKKAIADMHGTRNTKNPLEIKVEEDVVILFYTHCNGNATSFRDALPKDITVATFTFQEMYQWYGCNSDDAYHALTSKVQRRTLEQIIHGAIGELPHMKYSGGWVVRMFQ